jgi:hypothetical protein
MRQTTLTVAWMLGLMSTSWAVPKIYKHDQFSANLNDAAGQITGVSLAVQPGFTNNEAFGQTYIPDVGDYPVQITGVDLVMAAPPLAPTLTSPARIEIWNDDGTSLGAGPNADAPIFAIDTSDLFNPATQELGLNLQGNTALSIQFDLNEPDGAPPLITSGRIWVMIRYALPAKDLSIEWGDFQCLSVPEVGICGCQNVAPIVDQSPNKQVNIMHYLAPVGTCFGNNLSWAYAEDIGITGDFIVRLRAETAGGGCIPDCSSKVCGSDGCGGTCGTCPINSECTPAGTCGPPTCTPDCAGKQCGDNGCGGTCGTCPNGGQCTAGICGAPCAPSCAGKECGPDGCGGTCGLCVAGETCSDGVCLLPCTPNCAGKECGDDGCGGTCGACVAPEVCEQGQCSAAACVPDCAGKSCGDDGCGGTCGECEKSTACNAGICEPIEGGETTTDALSLTAISPNFGTTDEETAVSITGAGFEAGITVKLGGTTLSAVQVLGDGLLSATVPAGLAPGMYLLVAALPSGDTASLPDAFEVREAAPTANQCGDGACADVENCALCPADCGACPSEDEGGGSGESASEGESGSGSGASGGCATGTRAPAPWALLALLIALPMLQARRRCSRNTAR